MVGRLHRRSGQPTRSPPATEANQICPATPRSDCCLGIERMGQQGQDAGMFGYDNRADDGVLLQADAQTTFAVVEVDIG